MLTITNNCTRCGICAKVCPAFVIALEDKPTLTGEGCIRCGHCEAACPQDALRNTMVPDDEKPLLPKDAPVLDADTAELFLRSRRSNRRFLKQAVPQELTRRLLNAGRYAQTGSNSQGVSFMVLSPETLEALRNLAMDFFRTHPDPGQRKAYESFSIPGRDQLLRGAPMCILALTKRNHGYTARNAIYALTYVEAMAPSLGLATCWVGFLERYTSTDCPKMRRLLEIPDELVVSGALLYGYPEYRYRRAAGRDPLQLFWR